MADTRYPYTYACDLICMKVGYNAQGIKISRSDASQIRQLFSEVLNLNDDVLVRSLADYYLAHEREIIDKAINNYKQAGGV